MAGSGLELRKCVVSGLLGGNDDDIRGRT